MRLNSSFVGFVPRSISMLALLGVLAVPVAAEATSGGEEPTTTSGDEGGDVGSGGGAGSGDGTGTGTGGGAGSGDGTPASTGEPATSGATDDATAGSTSGATGDVAGPDPDDDSKGCSIGARDPAPGMLALALLGLVGLRRRRA
jgi:MYXO-CTERM domain-containing protein